MSVYGKHKRVYQEIKYSMRCSQVLYLSQDTLEYCIVHTDELRQCYKCTLYFNVSIPTIDFSAQQIDHLTIVLTLNKQGSHLCTSVSNHTFVKILCMPIMPNQQQSTQLD